MSEWGAKEDFLYTVWANQGVMPAALESMPHVPPHLAEYVRGFSVLSSRRQAGFDSSNPITLADILAYIEIFRPYDREKFVLHIISMDSALTAIIKKRQEQSK